MIGMKSVRDFCSSSTSITSRSNPKIKEFRRLAKSREHVLIEGVRHVRDAMRQYEIQRLLVTSEHRDFMEKNENVHVVSDSIMNSLSHTKSPSGVLALFERPKNPLKIPKRGAENRVVLVCDGVSDPGNLGTLLRTAHAFDCDAVITTRGGTDPYNEKCVRSSAGAILSVPVLEWDMDDSVSEIHRWFREDKPNVYVTDACEHDTKCYDEIEFSRERDIAIVMGSEADGASDKFKSLYNDISTYLNIPIHSESLNVGVACGVILSEVRRQERVSR